MGIQQYSCKQSIGSPSTFDGCIEEGRHHSFTRGQDNTIAIGDLGKSSLYICLFVFLSIQCVDVLAKNLHTKKYTVILVKKQTKKHRRTGDRLDSLSSRLPLSIFVWPCRWFASFADLIFPSVCLASLLPLSAYLSISLQQHHSRCSCVD